MLVHVRELDFSRQDLLDEAEFLGKDVKFGFHFFYQVFSSLSIELASDREEIVNYLVGRVVAFKLAFAKHDHVSKANVALKFESFDYLLLSLLRYSRCLKSEVNLVIFVVFFNALDFVVLSHLFQKQLVISSPLVQGKLKDFQKIWRCNLKFTCCDELMGVCLHNLACVAAVPGHHSC